MNIIEANLLCLHARICREARDQAKITVVNIKDHPDWEAAGGVYIGRAVPRRGLKRSMFANPFTIGMKHPLWVGIKVDRAVSIRLYGDWFYQELETEPGFSESVEGLRGKMLVCWCSPLDCHGRIIKEYLEGGPDGSIETD